MVPHLKFLPLFIGFAFFHPLKSPKRYTLFGLEFLYINAIFLFRDFAVRFDDDDAAGTADIITRAVEEAVFFVGFKLCSFRYRKPPPIKIRTAPTGIPMYGIIFLSIVLTQITYPPDRRWAGIFNCDYTDFASEFLIFSVFIPPRRIRLWFHYLYQDFYATPDQFLILFDQVFPEGRLVFLKYLLCVL